MRRLAAPLLILLALLVLAAPAGATSLARYVPKQLKKAGRSTSALVIDATTGRTLASVRAGAARIPASVEKLYTTSTALRRFGANGTLTTSVLGTGSLDDGGTWHGALYLRGGGDPTFGSATFDRRAYGLGTTMSALVARVKAAGVKRVTGGVYGDESWFDSLRGGPVNDFALDLDIGGPLSGLLYDRGLAREDGSALQRRPAKFAAKQLVAALRAARIRVSGPIGARTAPEAAERVASIASPTMATLIRLTLVPSDNLFAEMLLKDIGARFGASGSTQAGVRVVKSTVAGYGVHPTILDGSGLSHSDHTTPRQVVTLLRALKDNVTFRAALPVAGRSGTLAARMRRTRAQDRCQAKTGTLSNVSGLAGYCTSANRHVIVFSLMENDVNPTRAKAIEDTIAVALARSKPPGTVPTSLSPTSPTPEPTRPPGGAAPAAVR